jgi:hypothetical protein
MVYLDTFVERTEEYQAEHDVQKKIDMNLDAWNQLMSYLFLKRANSSKYGSLTRKYATDFSGGEDTYPKTLRLQKAVNILTNHWFDTQYSEKKKATATREREKQKVNSEKATSLSSTQKEKEKKQKNYICQCDENRAYISKLT